MAAEFYPPMAYSPVWLYIGVILLMAIGGWAAVIWAQTRPGRTPRPPEPPLGWRMARLKGDYLERIEEIVRLAEAGELDARRAHQALSVALRQFVHEASGISAPATATGSSKGSGGHGPSLATTRRKKYEAKNAPNSITSETMKSRMPSVCRSIREL